MRLQEIKCPSCGAGINLSFEGEKYGFCPFCGNQFLIDDGNRVYTENKNKNTRLHTVWTDEAEIERERRLDRENRREHIESLVFSIAFFLLLLIMIIIVYLRV